MARLRNILLEILIEDTTKKVKPKSNWTITIFRDLEDNDLVYIWNNLDFVKKLALFKSYKPYKPIIYKGQDITKYITPLVPWKNSLEKAQFKVPEWYANNQFRKKGRPSDMSSRRREVYDFQKPNRSYFWSFPEYVRYRKNNPPRLFPLGGGLPLDNN